MFFTLLLSAQDFTLVHHTVKLGETVKLISVKYKVNPTEIYKLNPEAVEGISAGMVLDLFVPKPKEIYKDHDRESEENVTTQEVVPLENIVEKKNTQQIVSSSKTVEEHEITSENTQDSFNSGIIRHKVQAQETLYSLARAYNVTLEQLKSQNPILKTKGLQIGQTITINPDKL